MSTAATVLQDLVLAGLLVATAIAALLYARRPGPQRGYLTAALGLIAAQSVLGLVTQATHYHYRFIQVLSTITFLSSAYLLLMFRHSFVPVARAWRAAAAAALAGVGIAALVVRLPYRTHPTYNTSQAVVLRMLVIVWSIVIFEPIVRFWMASRGRPRVQRMRLRSLSLSLALIVLTRIAIVLSRIGTSKTAGIVENSIALALLPLFYVTLIPPVWLRLAWRREEEQERGLTQRLVRFAPDRTTLASRALEWALRLVGSDSGFMLDANGHALATIGVETEQAERYAVYSETAHSTLIQYDEEGALAIAVPIVQEGGRGLLVAIAGPFTLLFGSDEMESLDEHADVIGFALERAALTETRHNIEMSKAQFLANAAHELRTPLASIVGFSELFADGFERMPEEAVQEGLAAIVRQGRRMSSLVSDLLDLTQMELGKTRLRIQPLTLSYSVEQSIANAMPPGGHPVRVDVDRNLEVLADSKRLDQILTNLLTNAFRYGGPNVSVEASQRDGFVRLVVADDGPGVPEDLRPELFEPFSRALDVQAKEGSGLGLAIVRSLVEAFGGRVAYEPGQPSGARFVIELRAPGAPSSV